jgi:signal peptidase II
MSFGPGRGVGSRGVVFAAVSAVLMMGCDHATKARAELALQKPLALFPGVLELRYARNPAIAFSLLQDWPHAVRLPVLLVAGTVAIAAIAWMWIRRAEAGLVEQLGYGLVLAGALGNFADRVGRGFVVDFIHVAHWPIFNVADAAIAIGAGLLFIARRSPPVREIAVAPAAEHAPLGPPAPP